MLVEAANDLNVKVNVLDAENAPAKNVHASDNHVVGSFKDSAAIEKLAKSCDVLTIEIEHVDTQVLEQISSTVDVQPTWSTIRRIQDKFAQKEHLRAHNVHTAYSLALNADGSANTRSELERIAEQLDFPFMLKSRREAYDGRGNFPVRSAADFDQAIAAIGDKGALYAEKWSNFRAELAVMVVKTKDDVLTFPTVETVHQDSICKLVYAPARNVSQQVLDAAQQLARKAVASFDGKGVFGVEMFLGPGDTLLVNEIAPRPHNSGHYTIEACPLSQYDAHLRTIIDLPITQDDLKLEKPAVMLNILGGQSETAHLEIAKAALRLGGRAKVHLYGKGAGRPGRKMGHVTVTADTLPEAEKLIQPLVSMSDRQRAERLGLVYKEPTSITRSLTRHTPQVAVLMGSHSDMKVLDAGIKLLQDLDISFETHITSAHRTAEWMAECVGTLSRPTSSVKVIIAAAGGAAHLPGMAASHTHLPVIGLPVKPSIGDGMDSLLSMTNMPRGVVVATVGINNAINAALLAARILGASDPVVQARVKDYMQTSRDEVLERERTMQECSWEELMQRWH